MNLVKCPKCNAELDQNSKYCHSCGFNLGNNTNLNPYQPYAIRYPKASIGLRLAAYILDSIIVFALALPSIAFFIAFAVSLANLYSYENFYCGEMFVFAPIGLILLIIPIKYEIIKDGLGKGQSFGKRTVGLMVVSTTNNKPCTVGKSALRELIWKLICLIPIFGWLAEPILVLATDDGRRLGDRVADTMVIEKKYYKE